ncbi:MAG: hypothetical protein QOF60_261 [Actinomycetota bacterium]|jgi:hypothetical protein|nr:hypothetical protein [Actinomycetota bacterium]
MSSIDRPETAGNAGSPAPPPAQPAGEGARRPASASAAATSPSPARANPAKNANAGRSSLAAVLAALALGLILGGAATAFYLNATDSSSGDGFAGVVDTTRYQAVILSNDKVYFGRIESVSDQFFRLSNAFFLRETPGSNGSEPVRALLPVNREIHAPDNTMLIRKADVILVENLAKDSPILTEIRRQLGNGK